MLGALSIGYRSQATSMQGAAMLMIGYSAAMAAFAFTRVLPYALVAQFVIGWTYFAVMTSLQTLIQSIVDEVEARPRDEPVPGLLGGLIPWGGLAMGASARAIGVTATFGAGAGICGVYAVGVLVWARGSRRMPAYRRRTPGCTEPIDRGMSSWKLPKHPRLRGRPRARRGVRARRRRHRRTRRVGRGVARAHAEPRLARAPRARHVAVRARHGRGHAERRRHGQQRGGAQRARRGPHLRPGREAGRRGDRRRAAVPRRGLAAARRCACANRASRSTSSACLSDGNVHSHIDHLFAMLRRCDEDGVRAVRVHVLLDGRDVPERSALGYVDALEELLETLRRRGDRDYRIASGGGRMLVTMDRYQADWRIVERGWNTHVRGEARAFSQRARGDRDALPRRSVGQRPVSPGVRDRRRERPGRPDPRRRRGGAVQLPRRPRDRAVARVRRRGVRRLRARAAPRRAVRGHDAVRRRSAAAEAVPRRAARDRAHARRIPRPQRRAPARDQRDAEVRPRDLLLERQPQRHDRSDARALRRDPERHAPVRGAALDEGRRDHRPADRRAANGALPPCAAQLRERRHGRPHRGSRRVGDRGGGGRPPARAPVARDREARAAR